MEIDPSFVFYSSTNPSYAISLPPNLVYVGRVSQPSHKDQMSLTLFNRNFRSMQNLIGKATLRHTIVFKAGDSGDRISALQL